MDLSFRDLGISNDQYAAYEQYKLKVEQRNNQIIKFEKNLEKITSLALPLIVFIFISFNIITNSNGFDNLALSFKSGSYGEFILIILVLCLGSIPLFLTFRLLWIIPEMLIDFLKLNELCKKIYVASLSKIPREAYFDVIEELEAQRFTLQNKYPDIEHFDYNLNLYFEFNFNQLLEYEREYVNKRLKLHNKQKQRYYWFNLSGREFEVEVARIYKKLDYKVELTPLVGDGGIDIKLWKNGIYSIVQCKNHTNSVSVNVARDLYGTMNKVGADNGILICSGGFTKGVFDFVNGLPIKLIDIERLLSKVNELMPNQIDNVTVISNKIFNSISGVYEFRKIGELMILYSQMDIKDSGKSVVRESKHQKKYCLFETEEEAKRMIDTLNLIDSAENRYKMEIAVWKVSEKETSTKSKSFYYIRVFKNTHSFLQKEDNITSSNFRSVYQDGIASRYRYSRNYSRRY
jgi:hypothetical protein